MSGNPQHSHNSGIDLSILPEETMPSVTSQLQNESESQNDDADQFDTNMLDHRLLNGNDIGGVPDTVRQVSYVQGDSFFQPRGSLERRQSVRLGRGALKTLEGVVHGGNNNNNNGGTNGVSTATLPLTLLDLDSTATRRLSTIHTQASISNGVDDLNSSGGGNAETAEGVLSSPYLRSTLHTSVVPLDLDNRRPTRSGSILEEDRPRLPPTLLLDRFDGVGNGGDMRLLTSPTNNTKNRVKQYSTLRGALFRMPDDSTNTLDGVVDEEAETFNTSYYDDDDDDDDSTDQKDDESESSVRGGRSSAEHSDTEDKSVSTPPPRLQHRRSSLQMGSDMLGDMLKSLPGTRAGTTNAGTPTSGSLHVSVSGSSTSFAPSSTRAQHSRTKSTFRGKSVLFAPDLPSGLDTGENYAPLFSCETEIPSSVLHIEEPGFLQPSSVDSPLFQLDSKQGVTTDNWKIRPFDYLMVLGVPGHNLSQAFCKAKQPEKGMHNFADETLQDPYPAPETDLQRRANESVKIFQEQARKRTPSPVILNCLPQVYKSSEPDTTWAHLAFPTGLTLCATSRPKRVHFPTITLANGNKLHASVLTFDQRGVWRVRSRNPYYVLTNLRELLFLDYVDGLFSSFGDKRISTAPPVDSLERRLLYEIDQLYTETSSVMPFPDELHDPQEFIVGNQSSMVTKTVTGESASSLRVKTAKKSKTGQIQLHHSKNSLCADSASTQFLVDHHEYKFYLDNHVNCIGFLEPYFNFHFPNATASDARSTTDSVYPGAPGVFGVSEKQGFTLNIQNSGGRVLGGAADLKSTCQKPELLVGSEFLKSSSEARKYYGDSYDREYGHLQKEETSSPCTLPDALNEAVLAAMLGEGINKPTKKSTVSIIDLHKQHREASGSGNTGSFDSTFIEGWEALREHLLGPLYPAVKAIDCQRHGVPCEHTVPVMAPGQPHYPSMDYIDHLLYRTLTYYHIVPSLHGKGDPCPSSSDSYLAMKEYYTDMLTVHAKLLEECKVGDGKVACEGKADDGKQISDDPFGSIEQVPVLINTANNSTSLETIMAINAPKRPLPLLLSPDDLIVYYPKAFMLVSHYPFYDQMEAILERIYKYVTNEANIGSSAVPPSATPSSQRTKQKGPVQSFSQWIASIFPTESQVSLSQYLQLLLYRVSVPVPGKISVTFSSANPAWSKLSREKDEVSVMTRAFLTGFVSKLPHKYKATPELFQKYMGVTFEEFPKKVHNYQSNLSFLRNLRSVHANADASAETLTTSLSLPAVRHPLSSQFSLVSLFSMMSVDNIMRLLTALLTERKIIVFSANTKNLSVVTHSLLQILQPLEWWHCFIPVLPISMLKVTQSLQPFILGIPTSLMYLVDPSIVDPAVYNVQTKTVLEYEKKTCSASYHQGMVLSNNAEQHVVTYDLDNDNLFCFDMLQHLPAVYAQRLAYGLIEVVEQLKLQNLANECALKNVDAVKIKQFDAAVYSLVWQFYGSMFHGLHKFIKFKGSETVFNKYLWLHCANQRLSYDTHSASLANSSSWHPASPSANSNQLVTGTLMHNSSATSSVNNNGNNNPENSDSDDMSPILPSFTKEMDNNLNLGSSMMSSNNSNNNPTASTAPATTTTTATTAANATSTSTTTAPGKVEPAKEKGGFWSRLFKSDKNEKEVSPAVSTIKPPEPTPPTPIKTPVVTNVVKPEETNDVNELIAKANVTLDVPRLQKKTPLRKKHASSLPIKLTPSQLEEVHNQYAPDLPKTGDNTQVLDHQSLSNINSPIARTQHRVLGTPGRVQGTPGKNTALPGQTVQTQSESFGNFRVNTEVGTVPALEPLPFFAALADSTAMSVLCSEYRTPSLLSDFVMLGEAWRMDMAVEAEMGRVTYPLDDGGVCIVQGETQVHVAPPPPPMIPTRLNLIVEQQGMVRIFNPSTGAFVVLNTTPTLLQQLCVHLVKQHSFIEGKKYDFSLLLPDCALSNVQKTCTGMLTHYHGVLPFGRPHANPIVKWSSIAKTVKASLTNTVPGPNCILHPGRINAANIANWLQQHACSVVIKATRGAVNYRHQFRVKRSIPTGVPLNHRQLSLPMRVEVDVAWYAPEVFVSGIVCRSQTQTAFPAHYAERAFQPGSAYGMSVEDISARTAGSLEVNSGPFLVLGAGVGALSVVEKVQGNNCGWALQLGLNAGERIETLNNISKKSPALKFINITPLCTSNNNAHVMSPPKFSITAPTPTTPQLYSPMSFVTDSQVASAVDRMDSILTALLAGTKLPTNTLSVLRHIMRDDKYSEVAPYYFFTSTHTRRIPIGAQFSIDLNASKVNVFHPATSAHQCHQITNSNVRPNIGHYHNFYPCSSNNKGIRYTSYYGYTEPVHVDSFFPAHTRSLFGAPCRQALLRSLTQPTTRARMGIIDYLHLRLNSAKEDNVSSPISTSDEDVGVVHDIMDAWGYPITFCRVQVQQSSHTYRKPLYTSLFARDYAQIHWISPAGFMSLLDIMVAVLEACLEAEDWSTAIQFFTLCREYCTPRHCCVEIVRRDYLNTTQKYKNTFLGVGVYEETKVVAPPSKSNPLVMNYENKFATEEEHMKRLCCVATPAPGKPRKNNAKTFIDANQGISPVPTILAYSGSKVTTIPELFSIYEALDKTKKNVDPDRRTKSQQPQLISQTHTFTLNNSCFVRLPFSDVWTPPSSNYRTKSISELPVSANWDELPQQTLVDLPEIRNHPIFLRPEIWIVCFLERIQIWKTLNPHIWSTLENIMLLEECVNATNQYNAQIQAHRENYIVARNLAEHNSLGTGLHLEDVNSSSIDIDDVESLIEIIDSCKQFITPETTFFANQYANWVRDIVNQITMHMGTAECSLAVWYYVTTTVLDSQIACIPIWVRLDLEEVLKTGPEIIKLAHESQTNNI